MERETRFGRIKLAKGLMVWYQIRTGLVPPHPDTLQSRVGSRNTPAMMLPADECSAARSWRTPRGTTPVNRPWTGFLGGGSADDGLDREANCTTARRWRWQGSLERSPALVAPPEEAAPPDCGRQRLP
jgi:hypothetical protein